jgi:D-alanyl-D-alanine carboxypeptidase
LTKPPCWHYSNTNYIVLGILLEEVTGMAVADIFRDWIFSPLGMTATSLPDIQDNAIPRPHPRGYLFGTNVQSNNAYKAAISGDVEGSKIDVPPGDPPNDATNWNPAYTWTSGSVISTLSDMVIWAKALATGTLLKPQTYAEQLHWAPRSTYGLGISEVMPGFVGHNGAIPGFQTVVSYSRDDGATIIVLTNSEVAPNRPLGAALPAENLAEMIRQTLFPTGDSQQRK